MRNLLLILSTIILFSNSLIAQTTYSLSGGNGSSSSGSTSIRYSCSSSISGTRITLVAEHLSGTNQVKFYVVKNGSTCSYNPSSAFTGSGTWSLFQGGSSIYTSPSFNSGSYSPSRTVTMSHTSGSRSYTASFTSSTSGQTWSITTSIIVNATTLTPNLTIGSNINFGTTTLYSGVNYTGSFSVSNTGSGAWSGSMYVVLGHGGTLSATGPSTINAGSTQSYTVSYTPNTVQSNTSASASYQTGGQGSGITVPGQSPPSLAIVGNLAITGNAVSPTSGTQNSTNFNFSASLSNVAPSPTSTVDIEFLAPDGLTYTSTNISRNGYNYSHSQTLLQAGTYQYRYIAYQGSRPNAASSWRTMNVTAPQPNLTIGSNINFGTTTLYSGVNYTGSFSVSNTGSGAWSGSMYVVLGHGGTLSATGPSTINAGSTQSYTVSYTPNTVQSNTSASASYQTGGQGSGITVPGQSPPSLAIVGNLAITGNAVSPTSGTQNSTNFNFSASLSNVAPSPTSTVDIEFLAPDGLTYTSTNISRNGYNYSHSQTLLQAGTYQYRYIAYQGSRPNAVTAWQSVIVSSNQSVNVTSPAANSTYQAGTNLPIAYSFTGYTGNVSIEITAGTNGTVGILPAIADGEPNTGSKSWLIPSSFTPGQYRIKVYNTGAGQNGNPTIVNYSGVFTITGNAACPNCLSAGITEANFPNTGNEGFCAAQYLCNLGIIQPQQNNAGYTPVDPIKRADLAKLMLYALFDDGYAGTYHQNPSILSFPVDSYVTPFEDLNYNNNPANYDRPAKVMSYLYYANDNKGLTPFKRTRTNFYPYENITRMDFLQVLLEAWNVPSDATNTVPFTDDFTNVPVETMQYIKKAYSLGLITHNATNPLFRPYDDIKREEAYTILARLRKLSTVTKPAQAVLTNAANYIFERNITTDNISIMRSMGEGNFAYGEDAFAIGDIGFPMSFGFSYNSFSTHLPDVYRRIEPLGVGWTHNLNSYIQTTSASMNEGNVVVGKALLLLANGDGTWHTYDNSNPSSPMKRSIDNFNTLNVITNSTTTYYEVKRPDQVTFKYEKQGSESGLFRLTSIKDRYGNTLSVVYKQGANVPFSGYSQVIDYVQSQSGKRIVFTYNTDNQITEVQFPGKTSATPRRLQFAYYAGWDGKTNYLRKFTSARHYGTTKGTTYTYGTGLQKHLLVSVKRPKGNEIKTDFGTDNKLQKIEEKNGTSITGTTTIARTTGGTCPQGTTCATITNSDNTITSQKINLVGTVYEITSPTVSFKLPEYSVNPSNPAYFEVNGKRTQYEYNGVGNVLIVKYMKADNTTVHSTESFGYDQYNNLKTHTDRNGITTNFDFSTDGKFLDGIRRPFAQNQTINQTFRYYPNGLLKEAISHEGINTLFYYDNYGNNNRIEFPLLSLNSYASHDYAGRTLTVTNAKNQVSTFEHDDNDNLTKTIAPSPLSYVTQYGFDDNELLNTITNAKGKVTTIGRDNFDRVETITFETMQQKYYYRADGKLDKYEKTGFATNNNRYFQYAYDAQGRMTSNRYLTNVTFDNTTKNIQTITGGTSALLLKDFTFDELNRPTGYTDNNNIAVGYGYDNNGNVTRIDYPNGHKVYYTYDQANRLRTVKWNTTTVATYVYVGSRLSYVQYGNGVRTTYNYDNAGRLDGITTKTNNGSGSTIAGYTFEFDNVGNHLTENITEPYEQPMLPTENTTYTYDDGNRILTMNNVAFTYDGDGNVKSKGNRSFIYDLEDNLVEIKENGITTATFTYDAFGNRRVAVRNGVETRYVLDLIDLDDVLAETNAAGSIQNYYIHGMGLVARVKGDGTLHYYHGDYRGSVVAMTNAAQTITHQYQYDDFGKLLNEQEADPNPFKYMGLYGIMHEGPDLAYMRARYYDPETGRFNSTDPIWSTNLYPYANNNGVMNVDLDGRQSISAEAALIPKNFNPFYNVTLDNEGNTGHLISIGPFSFEGKKDPVSGYINTKGSVTFGARKGSKLDVLSKIGLHTDIITVNIGDDNGRDFISLSNSVGIGSFSIEGEILRLNSAYLRGESAYVKRYCIGNTAPVITLGGTVYTKNCISPNNTLINTPVSPTLNVNPFNTYGQGNIMRLTTFPSFITPIQKNWCDVR